MSLTYQYIISFILLLGHTLAYGQLNSAIYDGGDGDGYDALCFQQSANSNIYNGGDGDGYGALCFQQSSNSNIYNGGDGDGYDAFCFQQSSNSNIYNGGDGDGYDAFCFQQSSNSNIYNGGDGDGYNAFCFEQVANSNIYNGGDGDGFDVFCFVQDANSNIFNGGDGDGFDVSCFLQEGNSRIFDGGDGDGYSQVCDILVNTPLPVELLVFDGELISEDDALLRWVVATEIDNAFFVLERSLDARNFEEIAVIASLGNTTNTREYQYKDYIRPLYGNPVVYYRLKQVDFDESFEYTHVIALNLPTTQETGEYILYPNPANERIFIRYANPTANRVQIELYDNLGRQLDLRQVDAIDLISGYPIDLNRLPEGSYHIRILDGDFISTKTFMKVGY